MTLTTEPLGGNGGALSKALGVPPRATPYVANFPVGSYTWTVPDSGLYRFACWGPGAAGTGGGGVGGGSGALCEAIAPLSKGQTVAVVAGGLGTGTNTTVTLPNARVLSGGASSGQAGGSATGGDRNTNGSAGGNAGLSGANGAGDGGGTAAPVDGGGNGGGAGAPGFLPYRGGAGAASGDGRGTCPGGGGTGGSGAQAGDGLVLIRRVYTTRLAD